MVRLTEWIWKLIPQTRWCMTKWAICDFQGDGWGGGRERVRTDEERVPRFATLSSEIRWNVKIWERVVLAFLAPTTDEALSPATLSLCDLRLCVEWQCAVKQTTVMECDGGHAAMCNQISHVNVLSRVSPISRSSHSFIPLQITFFNTSINGFQKKKQLADSPTYNWFIIEWYNHNKNKTTSYKKLSYCKQIARRGHLQSGSN